MEISTEAMQNIYNDSSQEINDKQDRFNKSLAYYKNENDITNKSDFSVLDAKAAHENTEEKKDVLRKADNRVSSNFHQFIVDQEAGYLATDDPIIDVGDDDTNDKIKTALGDDFSLTLNKLIVDAANAGASWLHYWKDKANNFHFAVVPPSEIYPIYKDSLESELIAVERRYKALDTTTGKQVVNVEYWDDEGCTAFTKNDDGSLEFFDRFISTDNTADNITDQSHYYKHGWDDVPFIKFSKNLLELPELRKYKGSIDIYDKVFNGFANDLEDIQQTILVLKGYGGAKMKDLWDAVNSGAIKVDGDGSGMSPGVDTLNIDIPTEARNIMLDTARSKIYDEAQAIDPRKFMDNGALSGKALKGLYAHLDLKATTTEKYFRPALAKLIRAIMKNLSIPGYDTVKISQTWNRKALQDDLEKAQIINYVKDVTSNKSIAKANPIVDDTNAELEDRKDDIINADGYGNQSEIDKAANNEE